MKNTKNYYTPKTSCSADDAKGNAEALLYLVDQGFKLIK